MHTSAYYWNGRLSQFTSSLKQVDQSIPSFLLLLVYAVFIISALLSARAFVSETLTRDTDFGFWGYSQSLVTTGEWKSCTPEYCNYASRMPLLPLLHTAFFLYSMSPLKFAYLQIILLGLATSALYIYMFRFYIQDGLGTKTTWFALVLIITLLGIPAKHAAAISCEEGLTVWLMVPLCLSITLLSSKTTRSDRNLGVLCLIVSVLAMILYLAKSTMILISLICIVYVLNLGLRRRSKLAVFSALVAITVPIIWGVFVATHTNRFSVMTSWDGENLFRGWNAESIALYPEVSLDREFDVSKLVLPDGREMIVTPKPSREDFRNEWEWNDYYKKSTFDFIYRNPVESSKFLLRKAYIYFVYIFQTPAQYAATPAQYAPTPLGAETHEALKNLAIPVWRLAGRVMQACFFALCVFVWIRLKALRTGASLLFLLNIAYAAPYIIGFSYDRHITVSIILAAGSLMAFIPIVMRTLLQPSSQRIRANEVI